MEMFPLRIPSTACFDWLCIGYQLYGPQLREKNLLFKRTALNYINNKKTEKYTVVLCFSVIPLQAG